MCIAAALQAHHAALKASLNRFRLAEEAKLKQLCVSR
jgi:hypothetical protein